MSHMWLSSNNPLIPTTMGSQHYNARLQGYILLPLSIDSALVDEDIILHIRNQLTVSRFNKWPSKIKQEVECKLTTQANGMFRWVVLRGSSQPGMARKVLKCVATTLDATYDQMLLGIAEDCQDQVFMALQWLDFSARPLLITELAEAVVVNPQGNPRLDPDDRLLAPAELLHFLTGLVSVSSPEGARGDRKEVRLAHFSSKEYLGSQRICEGPASKYTITDIAHLFIAEVCLSYQL